MTVARCQACTRDGRPCGVRPLRGGAHCFNHAPDAATARQRDHARRAGGKARGSQLRRASAPSASAAQDPPGWWPLATVAHACGAYAWTIRELVDGRLDPRTANAIVGAAGGLVHALRDADLERRIEAAERALGFHSEGVPRA